MVGHQLVLLQPTPPPLRRMRHCRRIEQDGCGISLTIDDCATLFFSGRPYSGYHGDSGRWRQDELTATSATAEAERGRRGDGTSERC